MAQQTIARLYDSDEDGAQTVRDLEGAGFSRDDISIVASNAPDGHARDDGAPDETEIVPSAEAGAAFGAIAGGGVGLLAGFGSLAIPGIGPLVAAGWLITALAGLGTGAVAGGLLGGLVGVGIHNEDAELYAEGLRRGATLVTVRGDDEHVFMATQIMDRNRAVDIAARRTAYLSGGWTAPSENTGTHSRGG